MDVLHRVSQDCYNDLVQRRRSQVVKAGVCKTPIRGFESHRRLH